jgi:hypothetical protein
MNMQFAAHKKKLHLPYVVYIVDHLPEQDEAKALFLSLDPKSCGRLGPTDQLAFFRSMGMAMGKPFTQQQLRVLSAHVRE